MSVLPVAREPWMESGNCRGVDSELFFPRVNESRFVTTAAKAVCRACEVRAQCLEYALANGERFGVWGGYAPKERQRMQARQGWTAPPARGIA